MPACAVRRRRGRVVVVQRVLAARAGIPVGVAAGNGGLLLRRHAGRAIEHVRVRPAVALHGRPVLHVEVVEAVEQPGGRGAERVVHRVAEPALEQERQVERAPGEPVIDAREQVRVRVAANDAIGGGDRAVAIDIPHPDVAGLLPVAPGHGGVGELPDAHGLVIVEHLAERVEGWIRRIGADVDRLPDEPAVADVVRRPAGQRHDEVPVVRKAQIGGPVQAVPAAGHVHGRDARLPAPVLRFADVLKH